MATLEKIRSKSVLLFTVIIVALLAFILGDFFTSGRSLFGNGTTIASIGDHEVDVQIFQQRVNAKSQELQAQGENQDIDLIQAQVLNEMLFEKMVEQEYNNLGLAITGKELAELLSMNPQNTQLIDAIKNPSKYNIPVEYVNQFKAQLASIEKSTEEEVKRSIYAYLITGLFNANELDALDQYNSTFNKINVSFTSKELASLPDDEFQVTDAEIEAEWKKNKGIYRLENEMRTIDFFTVQLVPSVEDKLVAENIVKEAVAALATCNGVEAIASDVNFDVKTKTYTPSRIQDLQLKNFADTAKVGQVGYLPKLDNTYRIAKLLSTKMSMDSVNVSAIQATDSATLSEIIERINKGESVKTILEAYQESAKAQGVDNSWIRLSDPNTDKDLKEKFLAAKNGDKIIIDTVYSAQAIHAVYIVNQRTPNVKFCEIAEISYKVEPSEATINKLTGDLNKFLSENTTYENFAKNAAAAGYFLSPAQIDASSSHIGYMPETRAAVKWAMNADKGDISTPFSNRDNNRLLVVAVTGIFNDYTTTEYAQLKKTITNKLINDKKAEAIINEFKSKNPQTLNDYVALTNDTIITTNVSMGNATINTLGSKEDAFVGAVAAAEKGKVMGPIKTNKAVVAYQVNDVFTEGRPFELKEYSNQFNFMHGGVKLFNDLFFILKGNDKFTTKILDFYEN